MPPSARFPTFARKILNLQHGIRRTVSHIMFLLRFFLGQAAGHPLSSGTLSATSHDIPATKFRRLFVAGFQKCGTTSLHQILATHPEVREGDRERWPEQKWRAKEPHFFNREWDRGLDWYESLFLPGGTTRLDSTPNTLNHRESLPLHRIHGLFPDARFICLMRDPVHRAFSAWNHWRELPPRRRWKIPADPGSFARTIRLQLEARGDHEGLRAFISTGYYARHLKRFLAIFPRDQLLPLFTSDLENDFPSTLATVGEFAGLPDHPWTERRAHVRNKLGWLPDRATASVLREIYRPHDEALAELLGREPPWFRAAPPRPPAAGEVLRLKPAPPPPSRQRILIVLPALHSRRDNLDHARTVAAMAKGLRADGHEVTILAGRNREPFPRALLDKNLAGFDIQCLEPWPRAMDRGGPSWVVQSVALLGKLKDQPWDSMVLPAAEGIAHATLQWLAQGHHPHPCRASVYLAGRPPSEMHRARVGAFLRHPLESQRDWLERRCLELADDVLLPDRESLDACLNAGWKLPPATVGQPGLEADEWTISPRPARPWLCLHEEDASAPPRWNQLLLAGLEPAGHLSGVILLGSPGFVSAWRAKVSDAGTPAGNILENQWPEPGHRIILLASLANHTWLARDLLDAGLIPLAPENQLPSPVVWHSQRPLSPLWNARKWVKSMARLGREHPDHHLAFTPPGNWRDWLAGFRDAPAPARKHAPGPRGGSLPLVSVCMATYNRTTELVETLEAFRHQDWPNFEVVVVNDGSTDPAAMVLHDQLRAEFAERGWLWIDQPNGGPGLARNAAAIHARGEFVVFADDDNTPMPHHLRCLITTLLTSGCDIAMSHMLKFSTPRTPANTAEAELWWMPVGGDLPYNAFGNGFGETSMAMFRHTFLETGGFPPDREPGRVLEEDRLFLTRAAIQGLTMAHFPQPTYWYRIGDVARHQLFLTDPWSCQSAAVELLGREGPPGFRGLFEFASGQWDYRKNDLIAVSNRAASRIQRLEKAVGRWRSIATALAAEASRLLGSRRWRAANFARFHRPRSTTFPTLATLIAKVESLLRSESQPGK